MVANKINLNNIQYIYIFMEKVVARYKVFCSAKFIWDYYANGEKEEESTIIGFTIREGRIVTSFFMGLCNWPPQLRLTTMTKKKL